ncbi:IS256 family transposase [wastewater metagenome]|uniref:IS256 family transposase ISSpma2 n=2 Tax=unclassified sequences TaxID=12908 RepID=A0A5B8RII8_9ZZZZ|nr:IS256 family transposase [Arhodomonas sp. KWT]QEA07873.1 IS256 family transposase ISSpma2 [uncultured organism]
MTEDRMALLAMAEKAGETDFLRDLVREVVHELMEAEVESLCGAGRHERSGERTDQRNGYRSRRWDTRVGSMELSIPRLRHASYLPGFLEPRRAAEQALTAVVQEAYIQGVSTRSVDELVRAAGMTGISSSQVSRLCESIDERVGAFLRRPIEGQWPYLWLDATYVKAREGGRVVSKACVLAVAVNTEGRREVLGLAVGPAETEKFWTGFLRDLIGRGLAGVQLVISDAHAGLKKAVAQVLGASWQRCRVHFMRDVLAHVHKRHQSMVAAAIRTAFAQQDGAGAREQWRETADSLRRRFAKVAEMMDTAEEEVLAHTAFPPAHWSKIASTNPLERVNKEIKRRSDVVGIFPNEAAVTRLVGAVVLEQSEEWQVGRCYMARHSLAALRRDDKDSSDQLEHAA